MHARQNELSYLSDSILETGVSYQRATNGRPYKKITAATQCNRRKILCYVFNRRKLFAVLSLLHYYYKESACDKNEAAADDCEHHCACATG